MRNRLATAFFAVLLAAGPAMAAAPAGQVLALVGTPLLNSGGQIQALQLGSPVAVGDTVETPADAKVKLRMNDGSIISVASGSRLTIADYKTGAAAGRDAKLTLGVGLLRAAVTAAAGPSHFEVDTATGVAAVRSTDWFIRASAEVTQVGVLNGEVALASAATGKSVLIGPGLGARVFRGRDPVPPRKWLQSEFDEVIGRTEVGGP